MDAARPSLLLIAIVQLCDVRALTERLLGEGFGVTRIDAYGGFLRHDAAVLLVATVDGRIGAIRTAVQQLCPRRVVSAPPPPNDGTLGLAVDYAPETVELGGAVTLTVPIERVEYLGAPALAVAGRSSARAS